MTIKAFQQHMPSFSNKVYIDDTALVIGNVEIGEDSSVWPMTVLRGDVHFIRVGQRTNIQDGTVCHVTHYGEYNPQGFPLTIGDDVTIGHQCTIHACTIGNRVLVGMGSIILDGAIIQDDVMLGAGTLVSPGKIIESGYLWLGSPAKKVRPLTEKEIEFLRYSAKHYVELKSKYLVNSSPPL